MGICYLDYHCNDLAEKPHASPSIHYDKENGKDAFRCGCAHSLKLLIHDNLEHEDISRHEGSAIAHALRTRPRIMPGMTQEMPTASLAMQQNNQSKYGSSGLRPDHHGFGAQSPKPIVEPRLSS
jgi:hypothetical protein